MKTSLNRKQTNNSLVGGRKEERKRERRTKGWEKGAGKKEGREERKMERKERDGRKKWTKIGKEGKWGETHLF